MTNNPHPFTQKKLEEFDEYVAVLMRYNNDMLVRSASSGFRILFEKVLLHTIEEAHIQGRKERSEEILRKLLMVPVYYFHEGDYKYLDKKDILELFQGEPKVKTSGDVLLQESKEDDNKETV